MKYKLFPKVVPSLLVLANNNGMKPQVLSSASEILTFDNWHVQIYDICKHSSVSMVLNIQSWSENNSDRFIGIENLL